MIVHTLGAAFLLAAASFSGCGGGQSAPNTPASAGSSEPTTASDPGSGSPAPASSAATASGAADSKAPIAPSSAATPASAGPQGGAAGGAAAGPDRTMDDIRAVVAGNRDLFRACYERSLKQHPGIQGSFVLKFVVNPDGSIKSAEGDASKSQIHTPDLETCAIGVLRGLKFAPSRKGMESTVNYPFDFHPKGKP
jgi:TonB family protein